MINFLSFQTNSVDYEMAVVPLFKFKILLTYEAMMNIYRINIIPDLLDMYFKTKNRSK